MHSKTLSWERKGERQKKRERERERERERDLIIQISSAIFPGIGNICEFHIFFCLMSCTHHIPD
jgi:hypothetical protein